MEVKTTLNFCQDLIAPESFRKISTTKSQSNSNALFTFPHPSKHHVKYPQTLLAADTALSIEIQLPSISTNPQCDSPETTEAAVHVHAARNSHRWQHIHASYHISSAGIPLDQGHAEFITVESIESGPEKH
jgi:hypothetical protein